MSQNNPYLDLVNEENQSNNEYIQLAKEDSDQVSQGLSSSSFVAKDKNPDEHAQRVTMANRFGVRSDFVDQNYDTIKGKISQLDLEDKLNNSKDKTKEFLTDPDNLIVSKDDLDTLNKIEASTESHSFASQAYNALGSGLAKMNSMMSKTPAYIGNVSLIPSNIIRKLTGQPQVSYEIDNKLSEYYDNSAELFAQKAPKAQESITSKIKEGKYADAGQVAALQLIQNAPQQIALLGSALMGYGTAGLVGAGLTTAAEKADDMQDQNKDVLQTTTVAALHGTIEAAFESLGTMGILKTWENAIANEFGKQTAKEFMFSFGKTLTYSMLGEGNEEAATSLAQDFADYATGVNPDAMKGSIMRALDAGIVGGLSGGVMTAPTGIMSGIVKKQQIQQAKINQDFFLSIGQESANSKLRERLPEKFKEYADHLTKDGPVENTYIDVDGFKEFFQKKDINPALIAQELGISKEYDAAVESGHDIKVPTSVIAQKLAGSEYYQGISEHIKFNPEDLTVAQAKVQHEAEKNMLQEQYDDAKKDKSEDEIKTVEDSAKEVGSNIRDQLKEAGYSHKAASHQAKLYEEFFKVQGLKSGQMPMDLFNKYGLKIQNITEGQAEANYTDSMTPDVILAQPATKDDQGNLVLNMDDVDALRASIARGEAGTRTAKVDEQGNNIGTVATSSTFPEFFQNKGYTKKEVLNIIDKYKSGKKLTENQSIILEDLYNGMIDKINRNEYFQKSDYRGQHTSPRPDGNLKNRLDDLSETLPDIYEISDKKALQYYGYHDKNADLEVIKIIKQFKNNPDADVKIYRAVPNDVKEINNGDWVSLTKYYADLHGESRFDGKYNIVEKTVKARELFNAGDIQEWGYHNKKTAADSLGYDTSKILYHSSDKKFDSFKSSERGALGPGVYTYIEDESNINKIESLKREYGSKTYELYRKKGKSLESKDIHTIEQIKYVKNVLNELDLPIDFIQLKNAEKKALKGLNSYEHSYSLIHDAAVKKFGLEVVGYYGVSNFVDKLLENKGYVSIIGSLNENTVEKVIDPKSLKSIDANFQEESSGNIYSQENKGSLSFGKNRQFNINLFQTKDESTFLHETGHFFLEVMADLAQDEKANEQLKKDYQTILEWFDVKSRDEIKTEHHEKFARGFESYLMSGEAPSQSLKRAFHNFRQWLVSIYQKAINLNVDVNPEVKGVFDRMLAADEEINKIDFTPMFGDPTQIGMTDGQAYEYINAIEWARLDARDRLQAQLMQDLIRKKDSAYREKYNEIYASEMKKAKEMVEFKTIEAIKGDLKLSKPVIEKYYSVFKNYLPYRSTILDGGQHPDVVASLFGYENGQAMLQAIAPYRRGIEDYVTQQVATQMRSAYPELLESPELSQAAIEAAHNDNLKKVKRMELEYLYKNDLKVVKNIAERLIKRLPRDAEIQKQAEKMIANTIVRDLKPGLYRSAERKNAAEAAKAFKRGDFDAAFEAKRKEYLNFELFKVATKAKQDVEKSAKRFVRLFKSDEDMAKNRDMDLVNASRAILAEFGITRAEKTADDYLSKMKSYDPEAYSVVSTLVNEALKNKGNYKEISYDNFVEMRDAVEAIFDLSKSRKEIEIEGKAVNIDDAINNLVTQMMQFQPQEQKEYQETVDKKGMLKEKLLGAKASLVRAEAWTYAMDVKGSKKFQETIYRPVADATTKYRLKKAEVIQKYKNLVEAYSKNLSFDSIKSDELKFIFKNKAELIMAILHSGNESNLTKLLVGRNWGVYDKEKGLDASRWNSFIKRMTDSGVLTKEDFDFAQSIWDLMDSLKPDAQKAHKKQFGYYFNEITAKPFQTPFGEYRGGYIPAKTDPYSVEDGVIRREREEFENNNNSFQFPTTGRGFTKSRVDSYNMPLSLDINLLGSHIDSVLRFTYIEPTIKQVARIVTDKGFRSELSKIDTNIAKDMLVPWLQRSAQQKVQLPSNDGLGKVTDAIARYLRRNVATQIMFLGVTNTLQQFTGLVVAMSKVKPKYIRNALWNYTTQNKQMIESILDKSEFMKSTQGINIHEMHSAINEIILNPSTFEKIQNFSRNHTYILQSAAQNIVNNIVWAGAYEQGIENGLDEKQAIKDADSAVRTTQGTNLPEDISRYETGTATELLFKQFVGYFNMLANLQSSELVKISREVGLKKGAGRAFYAYMTVLMLPAVLSDIIVKAMAGKFDDDDDDNYLDDMMMSFFGSQFKTVAASIPYGGQLAVAAYNKVFTKNVADDRLSLSPVLSILESTVSVPYEVYKGISDSGDLKKKTVRDALQFIGILTGIPTGPLGKPIGYLMDVDSGKAQPTGPIDFTRGLITGKSGK